MKRASIAAVALLALALTGCAGTTEPDADEAQESAPAAQNAESTPEPMPTAEAGPMTVAPTEATDPTKDALQSKWYGQFGKTMQSYGYEFPLIEDSLPVGQYICDQSRAGVAPESIVAVQGLPEAHAYANTQVVNFTLNNGTALTAAQIEAGESLPDYCGILFP